MALRYRPDETPGAGSLDYSSPEAQESLREITAFIAEARDTIYRRTNLYERTLGLAVIPVLIRRGLIALLRAIKQRERDHQ